MAKKMCWKIGWATGIKKILNAKGIPEHHNGIE
jgi:hypothetical protein